MPAQTLLIVDHQVGLFQLGRDWDPTILKQNMIAHAAIGRLFDLPVVITSSAETGPNGPVLKEIVEMFPHAPLVKRQGEVKYVSVTPPTFTFILWLSNVAESWPGSNGIPQSKTKN